jgi:L-alanine-DL-glutamate epimerase-like enolase superfamily enzyme
VTASAAKIDRLSVAAYRIPTDVPEADGTLEWDSTTIVVVRLEGAGRRGLGYSYTHACAAQVITDILRPLTVGWDAFDVPALWTKLQRAIRNYGRSGIVAMAIAAVDAAAWDLKARLMGIPLSVLLGQAQESVLLYGSGGFTSYPAERLERQLAEWAERGFSAVKMKIGSEPESDLKRVALARAAIGDGVQLFVDANGAYDRKQAIRFAADAADYDVCWFEEPVSSDDLDGLRLVRDRAPAGMEVAAGEYGFTYDDFHHMLQAGAVDVLQADATRCAGVTGFLKAAALAESFHIPLSAHTAPSLHLHLGCALANLRHLEYFHDHVRVEELLFDGVQKPRHGRLFPALDRPGNGLALKSADAERYAL